MSNQSGARPERTLTEYKAIVRVVRRVLIDEVGFSRWLEQKRSAA